MIYGREAELAELDRLLTDIRAGRGRLVLISGPAGVGKTHLAAAATAAAGRQGLTVAQSYAVEDPGAPVLWPWLRLLRDWTDLDALPALEADEPDATARFRLLDAISDAVIARTGPAGLLLVLEDMHWADRTSVLLLRHLHAASATQRLGVLVTCRDGTPGPLHDAAAELVRGEHARLIALGGLSAAGVAEWMPELTGAPDRELAAALHRRTGGNPLLVRLVAQDLALRGALGEPAALDRLMAERPQLRRLVAARVATLSAEARDVLDAASVLGEHIVADVVAAVVTDRSDVDRLLDQALAAGVLRRSEEGLSFEHALVRDAVYAELAPARCADLHRRCALALADADADADADVPPAGSIARHWQRVDGAAAAVQCRVWAERADEQARARLAWHDATRYAELALAAARRTDAPPAEQARLLIRLAEVQFLANSVPASLQACAEAADLAETAGRPDLLAQAGLVVHGIGGSDAYQAISAICERALAALPPDAHALHARLHAQIAAGVAESEPGPKAAELAAQALAEAERSTEPAAILEAIAARHLAISVPHQVAERLELGRRAVALGAASRRPIAALWGHLWRVDAALQLGNIAAAEQEIAEIDRIARERRSLLADWHRYRSRALLAALTGEFAAARAANAAARELGQRCGDVSLAPMSYSFQLQLAIVRGDPAEVDPGWDEWIHRAPPIPLVRIGRPLLHALEGHRDQAREEFEEFRHLPTSLPLGLHWLGTIIQIGTAAVLLDDAEVAAASYPLLAPIARYFTGDGSGMAFNHGAIARLVGELALTAGRPDDAISHLRDAIAMNTRIGARPFTALSRLALTQALGAHPAADPQLAEASDLGARAAAEFRRLDMPGPLAAATRLANRISAARHSTNPLSARETEVAGLVAQALSNRQIAQQLVLSERTVETHVRSILNKLDLRTRVEIAAWMQRQNTSPARD